MFCSVTILLVVLMTWTGYVFVKDMYLNQLSEKVNSVSTLLASHINKNYLDLLEIGPPVATTQNYFNTIFSTYLDSEPGSQIFIFDSRLRIVVHSDATFKYSLHEPQLKLNEKEIFELRIKHSVASLPFKGNDGKWYLWGFRRLTNDFWLCIKESASKLEKVEKLATTFIYIGVAGIFLTLILSLIIAKSISHPVDKLAVYSSQIGKGNFDIRPPAGMKGEFEVLVSAMNKMKNDLSRSYRELAENQNEKEKMLAQIAHEIRNPLGGIELLAGLTKEDLQMSGMNTKYIEKIIGEVYGLKKLITSFLEYGRPVPANPEQCNVGIITDEALSNFTDQLKKKNIKVEKKIVRENIYFDKGHLKQIFTNIFANSIELMNSGGSIIIESHSEKNNWEIMIADNGPGIPPENISSIFEPFFTTKKNGTGLGLAVCKKLCSENKADITAHNRKDGGTRFTISGVNEDVKIDRYAES
jgi:signal transduction histidine kinase